LRLATLRFRVKGHMINGTSLWLGQDYQALA